MSFPLLRAFGGGIPQDVLAIVPELVARRYQVMPFARSDAGVKVAMVQPDDAAIRHWIAKRAGAPVLPHVASREAIVGAVRQYDTSARDAFLENPTERFDALLAYAHANNAADIHFVPRHDGTSLQFRVDGLLLDAAELARDMHRAMIDAVDVHARARRAEHPIAIARVATRHGERAILRLLTTPARRHTLQTLGLTADALAAGRQMLEASHGVVVVASLPGAGRTTTLYAILRLLRHVGKRIATVEDPIAHALGGVEQVEAPAERFADALRLVLRSAPDIVMVGDVRDAEVARMAFDAAMGGRLVLAGMDAADGADTRGRLQSFGIPQPFITSALRGIIAQHLVRVPCPACRVPRTGDRGRGCDRCHRTGYGGRMGVFEVGEGVQTVHGCAMRM